MKINTSNTADFTFTFEEIVEMLREKVGHQTASNKMVFKSLTTVATANDGPNRIVDVLEVTLHYVAEATDNEQGEG
jgi:hypothetical protein